ncbi:MAG: zinc-ribbon domain-containing protein [Nitrososphaerota archaeon]|nr:zinc-ribbon domain-containing protein [Nitrososphaerota archaeon]
MKSCTNCGRQLEDTDLFCPSCGTRTGARAAAPPPPGSPYRMPSVSPTFGEADRYALGKLYLGAIVMLIGIIAGYALDFGFGLFLAYSLTAPEF